MSKTLKNNTLKRAKEAESCKEEPSRMKTRLEHARQSIFNSLTNPDNQNCPEFDILIKKATFKILNEKVFDNIKDYRKQGYIFLCLNIYI